MGPGVHWDCEGILSSKAAAKQQQQGSLPYFPFHQAIAAACKPGLPAFLPCTRSSAFTHTRRFQPAAAAGRVWLVRVVRARQGSRCVSTKLQTRVMEPKTQGDVEIQNASQGSESWVLNRRVSEMDGMLKLPQPHHCCHSRSFSFILSLPECMGYYRYQCRFNTAPWQIAAALCTIMEPIKKTRRQAV